MSVDAETGYHVPSLEEINLYFGIYDENYDQIINEEEFKKMFYLLFSQNPDPPKDETPSHKFLQSKTRFFNVVAGLLGQFRNQ